MPRVYIGQLSQALFQEAQDALFLMDPDTDQLLDVNPMAERLSGFPRATLLGLQTTYLFRFETPGGNQRLRRASTNTGLFHSQEGFFLRTHQEGVWVPVNLTVTRLHVQPKPLGLIAARDMTEQRQAQLGLQRAEAELRRVLACVSDCLWSAELNAKGDWQYRFFSPVVEKITGRPPGDFLQHPERWRAVIHPDDQPRWDQWFQRLRDGQHSLEVEYRIVRPDKGIRWVRDSIRLTPGTMNQPSRLDGVLTDITTRKETEAELLQNQALLNALMENVPDSIYFKDRNSRFIRINRSMAERFGLSDPAQAVGKSDADFFNAEHSQKAYQDEQEVIRSGRPMVGKEEHEFLQDGRERWASSTKMPLLDKRGQIVGTFGISRDITETKRGQEALRQLAADLTRSNEQLQQLAADFEAVATSERQAHNELKKAQSQLVQSEKLAALGQMVAGVAHEINNPLAFVTNNTFVLQRDVNSLGALLRLYREGDHTLATYQPGLFQRLRAFAQRIDLPYTLENLDGLINRTRDGLKRIQVIVSDLRDFARLDESDLHQVDLNAGIESTLNIIRGRAKKLDVHLEMDLAPLPPVMCYPAKLNQVVLNLVANAIDACPHNGKVTVRSRPAPDGVEIQVLDNGSGIDPAVRDKIFDPFFTTKPPGQGTGLGLSISYRIVADHGGRIEVESAPGKGSLFRVHLPLQPPTTEARPVA